MSKVPKKTAATAGVAHSVPVAQTETHEKPEKTEKGKGRVEHVKLTRPNSKVQVSIKYPSKLNKPKSQKTRDAEIIGALDELRHQLLPDSTPPPQQTTEVVAPKEKKPPSAWNVHSAKVRKEHPEMSFADAMALAKSTYAPPVAAK